jgi:RNA polymerase sigma-70 factor, ECF subfamily
MLADTDHESERFRNDLAALRPHLLRFASYRLRDHGDAEDVTHDALLAALEHACEFQERASLRTWVTSIMKHRITDRHRARLREEATDPVAFELMARDDGKDPCELAESAQFLATLQRCIALLPERSATIFMMNCMEATTEEICHELGISRTNCWTSLRRARLALRTGLKPHRLH